MTIWYIDPDNGDDANNGTSTATPLKSYTKAGWTASLVAGDTVKQKCGTVFSGQVSMSSWKNNMTLTSYGSGAKPVIDAGSGQYLACVSIASSTVDLDGIVLDGFDLRNANYYFSGTTSVGAGVRIAVPDGRQVTNVKIRNCDIHDVFYGVRIDLKVQTNTSKVTGGIIIENNTITGTRDAWISVLGSDTANAVLRGVTIRKNKLYRAGESESLAGLGNGSHGLSIQTRDTSTTVHNTAYSLQNIAITDNVIDRCLGYAMFLKGVISSAGEHGQNKISGNYIRNFGWSLDRDTHGIWLGGCRHFVVEKNDVADGGVFAGSGFGAGVGIFVDQYSSQATPGQDGCQNIIVRRNLIRRCGRGPTAAVDAGAGIFVYISHAVIVEANIVEACRNGIYAQGGGTFSTDDVTFRNNTIIDNYVLKADGTYDGAAVGLAVLSGSTSGCTNIKAYGNIIKGGRVGLFLDTASPASSLVENNNLIYGQGTALETGVAYGQGDAPDRSNPQAFGTLDATDLTVDPLLDDVWRPKVGSPCIGAGSAANTAQDYSGKRWRNVPCIGAREYVASRALRA